MLNLAVLHESRQDSSVVAYASHMKNSFAECQNYCCSCYYSVKPTMTGFPEFLRKLKFWFENAMRLENKYHPVVFLKKKFLKWQSFHFKRGKICLNPSLGNQIVSYPFKYNSFYEETHWYNLIYNCEMATKKLLPPHGQWSSRSTTLKCLGDLHWDTKIQELYILLPYQEHSKMRCFSL